MFRNILLAAAAVVVSAQAASACPAFDSYCERHDVAFTIQQKVWQQTCWKDSCMGLTVCRLGFCYRVGATDEGNLISSETAQEMIANGGYINE